MSKAQSFSLYSALKKQIFCDHQPYRINLIENLVQEKTLLASISVFYKWSIPSLLIGYLYFCWKFIFYGRNIDSSSATISVSKGKSEAHAIKAQFPQSMEYLVPSSPMSILKKIFISLLFLPKLFKVFIGIKKRSTHLISYLRAIETISYYMGLSHHAPNGKYFLYSTDSNPWGLAFFFYGNKNHLESIFIPHGNLLTNINLINHNHVILRTPVCAKNLRERGIFPKSVNVLSQEVVTMKSPPSEPLITFFLGKTLNREYFQKLTLEIKQKVPRSSFAIKPHPAALVKAPSFVGENLFTLTGTQAIEKSDVVVTGNSSIALEALMRGRPLLFVDNLDYEPLDQYGLIKHGLITLEQQNIEAIMNGTSYNQHWYHSFKDNLNSMVQDL